MNFYPNPEGPASLSVLLEGFYCTGAIGNSGTTVTAVSAVPLLVVSNGGFSLVPRIVTTILKLPVLSKLNV
jgi:hypothetical protein